MSDRIATVNEVIGIDRVVHDPVRYALMAYLHVVSSADFTFLAAQLDVTRGNLSFHMGKLDEAGYVEVEKTFSENRPRTMYRLTDAGRRAFRDYRECMVRALSMDQNSEAERDE